MKLSDNFTLKEFAQSDTADELGIKNIPDCSAVSNLHKLVNNLLQPLRNGVGLLYVTSGFRSLQLNRELGSSDDSQHVKGQAVDIESPNLSNRELALTICENFDFDQLILENYDENVPNSGWVHVSYVSKDTNRNEVLTYNNGKYTYGIS